VAKRITAFVATACFLALIGCGLASGMPESTGPVTVRATRWGYKSAMVVEYDNGYVKTFDVLCGPVVSAWPGMRADISFYWKGGNDACYEITSVRRVY